jgi:hypothetical protein
MRRGKEVSLLDFPVFDENWLANLRGNKTAYVEYCQSILVRDDEEFLSSA